MATVEGRAGTLDITIEEYTELELTVTITEKATGNAVDLTDYTFACDVIRSHRQTTVLATPTIALSDAVNGQFTMTFSEAQITAIGGGAIFDIRAVNASGKPERLVKGRIIWDMGITDG